VTKGIQLLHGGNKKNFRIEEEVFDPVEGSRKTIDGVKKLAESWCTHGFEKGKAVGMKGPPKRSLESQTVRGLRTKGQQIQLMNG